MAGDVELWVPLVDEPIGRIVDEILASNVEVGRLVASPRRTLTFKTFAYIRAGVLLGELLVDHDLPEAGSESWVETLLRDPEHHARLVAEVRAVAEEVAADPRHAEDEGPLGPDEAAVARFREFARKKLG